jgi:serine protease Do
MTRARLTAASLPLLWLLGLLFAGLPAAAEELGYNHANLIRSLLPTVVNIAARKEANQPSQPVIASSGEERSLRTELFSGSGFVIDPSGIIVTNWHVVRDAYEITVTFDDSSRSPAVIMAAARTMDIALLKVDPQHPLAVGSFGNSDKVHIGDPVFAIGNPLGLGMSVSSGIISALNRDIADTPYDHFLQTDAAINHGNSGGPLFDSQGEVIGLNTALYSPTAGSVGLGFAIPSNDVRFVIERLRQYGWMRPGWIGVKIQQVTPEMAEAAGMKQPVGSLVAAVAPDGPSAKAGIRVGDIILRFGDKSPPDERALLREIVATSSGQGVTVGVLRNGQDQAIPLTVGEWPKGQGDGPDIPLMPARPRRPMPPDLGLSLTALTAENRARNGLTLDQPGVLVSGVAGNTDAAERGLVAGDVILRVQDAAVGSPREVLQKFDEARTLERNFVLVLVMPKTAPSQPQQTPLPKWALPKWMALRVAN